MLSPKVAYFSPLPPARSGIADHSQELLPHLASLMDITLFVDDPAMLMESLQTQFETRPSADYPAVHWGYDLPLYHMGNSRFHTNLYDMSLRYPGITVLHDISLYHFLADSTLGQGNRPAYIRELGYAQGIEGINWAWRTKSEPPQDKLYLSNRLVNSCLGLIVHSHYAQAQIRANNQTIPIQVIPEMMSVQSGQSRRRALLPWPNDALIFAALGQVTAAKQPHFLLSTFKQLQASVPQARFLFVGEALPDVDLADMISELGLQDVVYHTGFVPTLADFVDWTNTADVVLNLRQPTLGETSATALRAMAARRPLILFNHGWYSEIPDTAALKIPVMDGAALLTAMQRLANDTALRHQMGQAGQQLIQQDYAPKTVAQAYLAFIQEVLASPSL